MSTPHIIPYEDIQVGQSFAFTRIISEAEGKSFSELSGDYNPLHSDPVFAKTTPFGVPIVHGMLASSLFSRLVGMECPGLHCLYLGQTLQFRRPILFGAELLVRGTVSAKSDSTRLLTIKTEILQGGELAIDGVAKVRVLEPSALAKV